MSHRFKHLNSEFCMGYTNTNRCFISYIAINSYRATGGLTYLATSTLPSTHTRAFVDIYASSSILTCRSAQGLKRTHTNTHGYTGKSVQKQGTQRHGSSLNSLFYLYSTTHNFLLTNQTDQELEITSYPTCMSAVTTTTCVGGFSYSRNKHCGPL